jgi:hypothetical protein
MTVLDFLASISSIVTIVCKESFHRYSLGGSHITTSQELSLVLPFDHVTVLLTTMPTCWISLCTLISAFAVVPATSEI